MNVSLCSLLLSCLFIGFAACRGSSTAELPASLEETITALAANVVIRHRSTSWDRKIYWGVTLEIIKNEHWYGTVRVFEKMWIMLRALKPIPSKVRQAIGRCWLNRIITSCEGKKWLIPAIWISAHARMYYIPTSTCTIWPTYYRKKSILIRGA